MRMSWFGLIIGLLALAYGGLWWYGRSTHPISYGISFSSSYATWLHIDWKKMYTEMLQDLKPEFIRISADWDDIEKEEGVYDFSSVDFMMNTARDQGARVLLVVGQKTPRWPECHTPEWAVAEGATSYEDRVARYVEAVVGRYKDHAALEYWQVENEPFINFEFGECEHFRRDLFSRELEIVRKLDTVHDVVVTDSGELSTWRTAAKAGDIFGTTMYRVIRTPGGRVVPYDWLPMGWYRLRAALWGIPHERFFVSELQAEPWVHTGGIPASSVEEQMKTMNVARMKKNMEDAKHSGASRAYLWGVEWWYWMKYEHGDGSFIDAAKEYVQSESQGR